MVIIKNEEEIEKMREAGQLAARVLLYIESFVKAGISTKELADKCQEFIEDNGAVSATLGYHGFPGAICASVNEVVCHGIPSEKIRLKDGDIMNIDVTVIKNGYHGDASRMFLIGNVSSPAKRLVEVTEEAMHKGIKAIKPGVSIAEVGKAIEGYVRQFGYSIVRDYGGHGIGGKFHEEPHVHHFYYPKYNIKMKPGMIFTVEPMINAGGYQVNTSDKDGWTVTTDDGSLSAQFEHTILVTGTGYEILTKTQDE